MASITRVQPCPTRTPKPHDRIPMDAGHAFNRADTGTLCQCGDYRNLLVCVQDVCRIKASNVISVPQQLKGVKEIVGYKFYMLLKRLLRQVASILPWVIGCAVIVGAIVLVARQHHAATEKYEAAREERCASSFPFDSEKQETCKHERDGPGNYLPWGYELVAWPEGITAWLLLATLGGIFWQAKSTQQSVDAVRRSVEVQEAEFVQWVDMGDCAIEYDRAVYQLGRSHVSGTPAMQVCGHPGPMKMRFSFPLLNNTTRPLFIKSVRTVLTIGPQKTIKTFLTEEGKLVPPKDEYRL